MNTRTIILCLILSSEATIAAPRITFSNETEFAKAKIPATRPPDGWFWAHDIQSDQIPGTVVTGFRIQRLTVYGVGKARRFAAFLDRRVGPARTYLVESTLPVLRAHIQETRSRVVSICVDPSGTNFTTVIERDSSNPSTVFADLNEDGLHALVKTHRIQDLATYSDRGTRKFVVTTEKQNLPYLVFTDLSSSEVSSQMQKLKARPERIRAYIENGQIRFAGTAQPTHSQWSWHHNLDADAVAALLNREDSHLTDLDATRDSNGLRFTAIMQQDRR